MKMVESSGHEAYINCFDAPEYEPEVNDFRKQSTKTKDEADRLFAHRSFWRNVGIAGIFISLGAFIVAASVGFCTVLTIMPTTAGMP